MEHVYILPQYFPKSESYNAGTCLEELSVYDFSWLPIIIITYLQAFYFFIFYFLNNSLKETRDTPSILNANEVTGRLLDPKTTHV